MVRINYFVYRYPDLFKFRKADEVHIHDKLLYRTFLRYFPIWITPNIITLFRVIMTPIVFYLVLYHIYQTGVIAFLLVAFTDAMDGSLARSRNQITKFGMLFDPLADKLLIGSMVLLLVFRYFNHLLGIVILGIEIIFILLAFIAKVKFKTVKMANIWGKIKMILQVCAVFFTLAGLLLGAQNLLSFAAWIFGVAIGFAIVSLFAHGV